MTAKTPGQGLTIIPKNLANLLGLLAESDSFVFNKHDRWKHGR